MDLDIEKLALLKAMGGSGGGGGGSGAVVRTYTGTLDTVFEENAIDFAELCNAVEGYNTSAIIEFDYENTEADQHYHFKLEENVAKSRYFYGYGLKVGSSSNFGVCYVNMTTQGKFNSATDGDGNPINFIDGEMPCTLTIIDHPLSSSITAQALSVTVNSEYDAPLGKLYNHVSVEVPQHGATVSIVGTYELNSQITLGAARLLTFGIANNKNQSGMIRSGDVWYAVYVTPESEIYGIIEIKAYYINEQREMVVKTIKIEDRTVILNELNAPFDLIRIIHIFE